MSEENSTQVQLVEYEPRYLSDFARMNKAWIEKSFVLEEGDKAVLANPEKYILQPGGAILMALLDGNPVGTCSLLYTGNGVYELSKMAVDEAARGNRIGRLLGEAIIERTKAFGGRKLELYSNKKGSAVAIILYEKLGFKEVSLNIQAYERADIKMELDL